MPRISSIRSANWFIALLLLSVQPALGQQAPFSASVFTDPARMEKIQGALSAVDAQFKAYAEKNHIPGTVYGVVVDGKLVHSGQIGVANLALKTAVKNNSLFRIASMTKSFTAMAIVRLRDEGKLVLSDPVSRYLPELKTPLPTLDAPEPSLLNLLTMTAGFPEDNPWGDRQLEDTEAEFLQFLKGGISYSNLPSTGYEYSNMGYAMLGQIVTRVSGMSYQQYITEYIFKPLGMTHTFWEYDGLPAELLALGYRWEDEQWKPEPILHDGAYGAMGGLITSLDDFSKYLAFHLSAWPARNDTETGPIRRASVREMHQMLWPRLQPAALDAAGNPCPAMTGYGYGLGVRKDCEGNVRVSHSGGLPGFGSNYVFYPDYGIGVIAFSNRTYAPASAITADVIQQLIFQSGIKPRKLLPSSVLLERQKQVLQFIQTWDSKPIEGVLAENFFLDSSLGHRRAAADPLLKGIGKIIVVDEIEPENQLRGTFRIRGETGDLSVFFTLSPEATPKIQALDIRKVAR